LKADPSEQRRERISAWGILAETIRRFTLQVGYTKAEHEYDWSLLFAVNRKVLDPIAKRVFFVPDPVRLEVEGAPAKKVSIPFHPEADLGTRSIDTSGSFFVPSDDIKAMAKGTVFRLMDLYNVELLSSGGRPSAQYAGDKMLDNTRKIQWVTPDKVDKVVVADVLFGEDGKFNQSSLKEEKGYAENAVSQVQVGEVVQFPRFGFCRLDSPGNVILAHK